MASMIVARDQRFGPHGLGEMLEVGLRQGRREVVRVVHDQDAGLGEQLAEGDRGGGRPRTLGGVLGRVVAQHDHVELVDAHLLLDVGLLHVLQVPLERAVLLVGRRPRACAHRPVRLVGEVAQAHQRHFVPALAGGQREARGGVDGLLGRDVVDDKSDLHGVTPINSLRDSSSAAHLIRSPAVGSSR